MPWIIHSLQSSSLTSSGGTERPSVLVSLFSDEARVSGGAGKGNVPCCPLSKCFLNPGSGNKAAESCRQNLLQRVRFSTGPHPPFCSYAAGTAAALGAQEAVGCWGLPCPSFPRRGFIFPSSKLRLGFNDNTCHFQMPTVHCSQWGGSSYTGEAAVESQELLNIPAWDILGD